MSIRSFIAIPLSDDSKTEIRNALNAFKKINAHVKWVKAENLHVTLKFLGNIETNQVNSISASIEKIAEKYHCFDFSLRGSGTFPDMKRPRVIWIGIRNHGMLLNITRDVENVMVLEGFKKEKRPFRPHITIGRIRSLKGIDKLVTELVKYNEMDFGTQSVDCIHLMESILRPEGAEYKTIFKRPLRRA